MLLLTLGVLIVGALVASGLLIKTRSEAKDAQAALARLRLESAAESGMHRALFLLATSGSSVQPASFVWKIDDHDVSVMLQPSDGLINLPRGRHGLAQIALTALGAGASGITPIAQWGSLADLRASTSINDTAVLALSRLSSFHADRDTPDPDLAPAALKPHLPVAGKNNAIEPAKTSAIGKVMRIEAHARRGRYESRTLIVEARLTGQREQPLWVYEWLWLEAADVPRF